MTTCAWSVSQIDDGERKYQPILLFPCAFAICPGTRAPARLDAHASALRRLCIAERRATQTIPICRARNAAAAARAQINTMILKISGNEADWLSSAEQRLPGRRRPASYSTSPLFRMVDEESREQVVRDLHLGLALVGEVALEAPPAEVAPGERRIPWRIGLQRPHLRVVRRVVEEGRRDP